MDYIIYSVNNEISLCIYVKHDYDID